MDFKVGDKVLFEGKEFIIVDFVPATDRWEQDIDGFEAFLYFKGRQTLNRIHTKCLKKVK